MAKEMVKTTSAVESIQAQNAQSAVTGDGVDLADYESATVYATANGGGIEFAIEHSDDDGNADAYTTPDSSHMVDGNTAVTPADGEVGVLGYIGPKRYIRVVSDGAGVQQALVVRGHARNAP